jgi:hypothetical protein
MGVSLAINVKAFADIVDRRALLAGVVARIAGQDPDKCIAQSPSTPDR